MLALLVLLAIQTPTTPPRDVSARSTAPSDKGVLRGRVLDAQSGQPLKAAGVQVFRRDERGPAERGPIGTTTDAEGRWEIGGLPFGDYHVSADKAGYVQSQVQMGRTIALSESSPERAVDITLARGAVLSGRVTDADGEPRANVHVSALRQVPTNKGPQFVSQSSGATTDDRGEFRVFGLEPGEYVLSAQMHDRRRARRSPTKPRVSEVPTFYPDATTIDAAQRFNLGAGVEYSDLAIVLQSLPSIAVTGRIVSNGPINHAFGTVMAAEVVGFSIAPSSTLNASVDGTFRIDALPAGSYRVSVRAEMADGTHQVGELDLTAGEEDISDVVIQTFGPTTIRGRVVSDPPGARLPEGMRVQGSAIGNRMEFSSKGPSLVKPDGTFELQVFYSPIRIYQAGPIQGWFTKGVRWKGQDVTRHGLAFSRGEAVSGVELVLQRMASRIAGTVTGIERPSRTGDQESEGSVIVFRNVATDDPGIGISGTWPIRDGLFSIGPMPAGDYSLVAVRTFDRTMLGQPERMDLLRAQAVDVTVADDETRTVNLRMVSP